jgi:hypothetical protein
VLRLPDPPTALRCLRLVVPRCALDSIPGEGSAPSWVLGLITGYPIPDSYAEESGPPKFLGDPCAYSPRSQTPAGLPHQAIAAWEMLPAAFLTTSATTISGLSRLHPTARTLAVYASQRGLPQRHARLASGWWPAFPGRDWLPAGPLRKVSGYLITFPLSQACLAHKERPRLLPLWEVQRSVGLFGSCLLKFSREARPELVT